jgi:predicted AlkP superfamily pyrophosphatase or phosphodiesterase
MKQKLVQMDCVLGYLIEQLKSHHLIDKLNVILTSDHGMEKSVADIYLASFVDTSLFDTYGSYAAMNLFLKKDSDKQAVFEKLSKIENAIVYKREDIPSELFVKNNVRTGDIMVIARRGYMLFVDKSYSYTMSI